MNEHITIGEIGRRLDRHEGKLDAIADDVRRINGSIAETRIVLASHEAKLTAHDLELRDVKKVLLAASAPSDRDHIMIPINGKTIAALLIGAATVALALAAAYLQVLK